MFGLIKPLTLVLSPTPANPYLHGFLSNSRSVVRISNKRIIDLTFTESSPYVFY